MTGAGQAFLRLEGGFFHINHTQPTPPPNTATTHKLARMILFMLTRGESFVDQGQQQYEEQQRQRAVAVFKSRAGSLGFALAPAAQAQREAE